MDWLFSPRKIKRDKSSQLVVNEQSKSLKLYQFYACPFCVKTRRSIKKLNLSIENRNAQSGKYRDDLYVNGGEVKVPCLRITEGGNNIWMYESSEIIKYLNNRF